MINPQEIVQRIRRMALVALILMALALILDYPWVALGIVLGGLAGIFNYWFVTSPVAHHQGKSSETINNSMLIRQLLRFAIAGGLVLVTGLLNVGLLMGTLVGLTLEMQTYLWEAGKQILGKSQG